MSFTRIDLVNYLATDAAISHNGWATLEALTPATDLNDTIAVLRDDVEGDGQRFTLTGNDIVRGLELLIGVADKTYTNHGYTENRDRLAAVLATNAMEGDYDQIDADAAVQMACFGELIYG